MSTKHIPTVITACCVLPNICEIYGEYFNDNWLTDNTEYKQPSSSLPTTASSSTSSEICNTLVEYLYTQLTAHYYSTISYYFYCVLGMYLYVN